MSYLTTGPFGDRQQSEWLHVPTPRRDAVCSIAEARS